MSYISLEANISVGKSTLLPQLGIELEITPLEEDLSSDGAFLTALGNYNENPDLALDLQLTINAYRVKVAKQTLMGEFLVERSMLSDMVFARVMNQRGDISNGDYKLFMTLSEHSLTLFPPEIVVHLACDPEVAYSRMLGRGRPEESNNNLEYMTQLEAAHEDMLPDLCDKLNLPLVRLDYTNFMKPERVAAAINRMRRLINVK